MAWNSRPARSFAAGRERAMTSTQGLFVLVAIAIFAAAAGLMVSAPKPPAVPAAASAGP